MTKNNTNNYLNTFLLQLIAQTSIKTTKISRKQIKITFAVLKLGVGRKQTRHSKLGFIDTLTINQ